ncbi:CBS domain-containing protein [Streptomyces sp. NPDC093221]|uniref:CBS domain-containing protein n=1 Tax=Streptomyces sp. NPDC093221 TaxID=3366032 RepID=UPI0037F85217
MKQREVGIVMTSDVVSVRPATPFKDIAGLLGKHRVSGVPVVDDDEKVIGVISATDLMFRQAEQAWNVPARRMFLNRAAYRKAAKARARTAGELMSAPAVTVQAYESVVGAARTMLEHGVERLPVLDEESRLVGIVTRRDLLRVFLRPDDEIRAEVIDEVFVKTFWAPSDAVGVTVTGGVVTLEGRLERADQVPVAGWMTGRIDGVVGVVNRLTSRFDDSLAEATRPEGAR